MTLRVPTRVGQHPEGWETQRLMASRHQKCRLTTAADRSRSRTRLGLRGIGANSTLRRPTRPCPQWPCCPLQPMATRPRAERAAVVTMTERPPTAGLREGGGSYVQVKGMVPRKRCAPSHCATYQPRWVRHRKGETSYAVLSARCVSQDARPGWESWRGSGRRHGAAFRGLGAEPYHPPPQVS